MTVEEMKAKKIELGLTTEDIAGISHLPLGTLQKVFSGATKAPRKSTIEAIEQAFLFAESEKNQRQQRKVIYLDQVPPDVPVLGEPKIVYGSTAENGRKYTVDDYYALPDYRRVELIDGKFYEMYAPSKKHQLILGELHLLFQECIRQHNMPCRILLAPCDVQLDRDKFTMIQPDLFIYCHESDISRIIYEGAPDLVVEIISPSSRFRDLTQKLYKYQNAGVREYWIVDPRFRTVTVHYFDEEEYHPIIYDFFSEIPVALSKGKCAIDFSVIGNQFDQWPD